MSDVVSVNGWSAAPSLLRLYHNSSYVGYVVTNPGVSNRLYHNAVWGKDRAWHEVPVPADADIETRKLLVEAAYALEN